jgi:hypothetical protein
MDMVLIRLAHPEDPRIRPLNPEVALDILWAAATPDDRLEHIRARYGPTPDTIDLALFHRADPSSATAAALRVCGRAILRSPALAAWTATVIPHQPDDSAYHLSGECGPDDPQSRSAVPGDQIEAPRNASESL